MFFAAHGWPPWERRRERKYMDGAAEMLSAVAEMSAIRISGLGEACTESGRGLSAPIRAADQSGQSGH